MKLYMKVGSIVVGLVVLMAVWIPNLIVDSALAKGGDSTIGGISIKNLEDEAIETAIQEAIDTWQDTPIHVEGAGLTVTLDPTLFAFDVASSIAEYHSLTDKSWYDFWKQRKTVHIPLHVVVDEQVKRKLESVGAWEVEATLNEIVSQASYLQKHEIEATVADTSSIEEERLALSIEDIPKNALGVVELANSFNDFVIAPNEPFSFLATIGETFEQANSEGVDFVASMIYHIVLQTDYEILERHSQKVIPEYLQQGLDAGVNRALNKDLQFVNHSDQPNRLKLTVENNSLKVETLAQKKEKEISVRVSKDKIIKPRIITRYSKELAIGAEEIVQKGQEGVRVEVYRSFLENGSTREELVSRDYYAPINKIVVQSSRQPKSGNATNTTDTDLQLDLDGDGLPDTQSNNPQKPANKNDATPPNRTTSSTSNDPEIVYGYYDKGGNFVQTSP
ncbi:VanW family protein [Lysinibacillus sp. NPDC048646]|uniref:VanW family protein n=1 Tax=Lysinibacillus sp. NPDC048646 TaxID=3390574 RepID=UPI003D03866D